MTRDKHTSSSKSSPSTSESEPSMSPIRSGFFPVILNDLDYSGIVQNRYDLVVCPNELHLSNRPSKRFMGQDEENIQVGAIYVPHEPFISPITSGFLPVIRSDLPSVSRNLISEKNKIQAHRAFMMNTR